MYNIMRYEKREKNDCKVYIVKKVSEIIITVVVFDSYTSRGKTTSIEVFIEVLSRQLLIIIYYPVPFFSECSRTARVNRKQFPLNDIASPPPSLRGTYPNACYVIIYCFSC